MEIPCPPPHMLFFEPLDDRKMIETWKGYRSLHEKIAEFLEIDASDHYSIEEFTRLFELFVSTKSSKRIKIIMIWHSHFLSLACQQSLRRLLETKSFRARVWFHVEFMNNIQSAIASRCIVRHIQAVPTTPEKVAFLSDEEDT